MESLADAFLILLMLYLSLKIKVIKKRVLTLLLLAAAIKTFSVFPAAVERYYSNGAYPVIANVQRALFGWIPFSMGDLLYASAAIWLIHQLIHTIRVVKGKQAGAAYWRKAAGRVLSVALTVYIIFNVLWGLNYNRYGINYQLSMSSAEYTPDDLKEVTRLLADQINRLQPASLGTRSRLNSKKYLFGTGVAAYRDLARTLPDFSYKLPSIKPSLYSYLGNYLGFTGYYNPFTGEAQVNTTVPLFIRPFTTCHEIGHGLGYGKESEANFAAYLSGTSSQDPAFRYSIYFELYAYAARYMYYSDSLAMKQISASLGPAVKKDIRELRAFFRKYENPFETAVDRIYAEYLRANEQPSGKMSYNEVVGMLIAYYKKNGKI